MENLNSYPITNLDCLIIKRYLYVQQCQPQGELSTVQSVVNYLVAFEVMCAALYHKYQLVIYQIRCIDQVEKLSE